MAAEEEEVDTVTATMTEGRATAVVTSTLHASTAMPRLLAMIAATVVGLVASVVAEATVAAAMTDLRVTDRRRLAATAAMLVLQAMPHHHAVAAATRSAVVHTTRLAMR